MNRSDIHDMLKDAVNRGAFEVVSGPGIAEGRKPKPIVEAQIEEIRALAAVYFANPFKVGELVTPKKTGILRGHGSPMMVVEIVEDPEIKWEAPVESTGHPDFGARFNIRVMGYSEDGEHILAWWNEAYNYEPWFPSMKSDKQQS